MPELRLNAMKGTAVSTTATTGAVEPKPNHSEAANAHTTEGSTSSTSTVSFSTDRKRREPPISRPSRAPSGMPMANPMP